MNVSPHVLALAAVILASAAGATLGEARAYIGWPRFRRRATGSAYLVVSNLLTLLAFGLAFARAA